MGAVMIRVDPTVFRMCCKYGNQLSCRKYQNRRQAAYSTHYFIRKFCIRECHFNL